MNPFPQLKSQEQIDRDDRNQRTREIIADISAVVFIFGIIAVVATMPTWLPIISHRG